MDISESATDSPVRYITIDFCSLGPEEEMKNHYQCNYKDLLPLFVKILALFQKHGENQLMEILEILYRILNSLRKTDSIAIKKHYYYLRISKAIQEIQHRIGDPTLTIQDLADVCDISTVTLNHFFKKLYQMPASNYLLDERMKLAKTLLLNSSNTIGDIAKQVGYGDIYAFSHAFLRCFGVAPSVWRNNSEQPTSDYE